MPRIPEVQFTAQASGPVSLQHAGQGISTGAVGEGLAQLGHGVTQVGNVLKDAYDQSLADSANAASQNELQNFSQTLVSGTQDADGNDVPPPAWDKHQELYQKEVDRLSEKYGGQLSGRALYSFQKSFTDFSNRQGLTVSKNAIDMGHAEVRKNVGNVLQNLATNFVKASPLEKPQIQKAAGEAIDQMHLYGIASTEQADALRKNFIHDTAVGSMLSMMKSDPMAVAHSIDKGEWNDLPVDQQMAYRNQALTQAATLATKQRQDDDRLEAKARRRQDDLEKDTARKFTVMASEHTLTPTLIKANAHNLSVEQLHYFMKEAGGNGAKETSPVIYAQMRHAISNGVDVRGQLDDLLTGGHMKLEDYSHLYGLNEARAPGAMTPYAEAEHYLKTALAPGKDSNIFTNTLSAKAHDALTQYATSHPKATRDELMVEATRLGDQGKLVKLDSMAAAHLKPRNLDVNMSKITLDDLARAIEKTRDDKANGRLDEFQFNNEMKLIKDLDDVVRPLEEKKKQQLGTK